MKIKSPFSYPHLYPKPVAVIGTLVEGRPNFFTIADITTSGYKIPRFILSVAKTHYSTNAILENASFSVNLPSINHVQKVDYCGVVSGDKEDKSTLFQVFYGIEIKSAPLIEEFPICYACKLINTIDFGDTHYIFIGEIVETYIDESVQVKKKVDLEKLNTISYCNIDNSYRKLGEKIGKAYKDGFIFKKNYCSKKGNSF